MSEVPTRYETARVVAVIEDLFGWLMIFIGVCWTVLTVMSLVNTHQSPFTFLVMVALFPSVGLIVAGVVALANGQLLVASLDTADATREMLFELRRSQQQVSPGAKGPFS